MVIVMVMVDNSSEQHGEQWANMLRHFFLQVLPPQVDKGGEFEEADQEEVKKVWIVQIESKATPIPPILEILANPVDSANRC